MKEEKNFISNERKCDDLQPMEAIISSFAKKLIGKKAFIEADIIRDWPNIVGEDWASYTRPNHINFKKDTRNNGTLHIEVSSGALALELELKSPLIISKVNTYFGYNAVERIKIIQNLQLMDQVQTTKDNFEKTLVSTTQETYIKQQTNEIANPDLKATLNQLGQAIFEHNNQNRD